MQDFESAIEKAEQAERAQNTTAMRQALAQAVDLYRGDLLPSCYDEWILPERDRLRQSFFKALVATDCVAGTGARRGGCN